MHVFVASHNGSEGDRGRIGRGRTQVPRFPFPSHKEHTQPPLKVGSVRCDTAAAVAAASWRGGPLYCILARLPPSTGGIERCSKGHPKHTTRTHAHETWQGKHNCLPPPPPTTSTKTPMAMFCLRDNLAARSEAGRRLRTCQRRAGRIGTKISNCKSVVMVFTVSVGFAMDGILGVSESRKRCVCNGRRPIPNFFAQDDEVLHSQKAR